VLLACLHPDAEISSQVEVLEQVSKQFHTQVKVCLLCDVFTGAFGQTYGVEGTPTYLIIRHHRVLDRLLGQVDEPTLTGCINRTLTHENP
jgi:Na+-transporting NADH:ubiquinone oxidoreductase subunit NqrB